MKELKAKWLVQMVNYISQNHQLITDGFLWGRIPQALDQIEDGADEVNFEPSEYEDENLDNDEHEDPKNLSSEQD